MSKSIKDWNSQSKGSYNAVKITNEINGLTLHFKYDADTQHGIETQFCEQGELTYVAESYFRSSMKLLSEVDKINVSNNDKSNYYLTFYFLPAMFCFRHYVELKMKIVFLDLKKDKFIIKHDLHFLRENIEQCGFSKHCFDEAIELIDYYEQGHDEFFRYLLTKDFVFTTDISILHGLKNKIEKIYYSIEHWSSQYFSYRLMKELLENGTKE